MRGSEGLLLSCQKKSERQKATSQVVQKMCEEGKKKNGKKTPNWVTREPGFVKKKKLIRA